MSSTSLNATLAVLVRGSAAEWTSYGQDWSDEDFFEAAERHGITPLLAHQFSTTGAGEGCPPRIREQLSRAATERAGLEALRRRELGRVLAALDRAGVRPILFKGTALAYTRYSHPSLRDRMDTDLLVPLTEFPAVETTLTALGYERQRPLGEGATSQQAFFRRRERFGLAYDLDVHWRISNRPLLVDFLTYDELMTCADPLTALHPSATVPCRLHALLIASVHRVAHHNNAVELLWLHDIDLLTRGFTENDLVALRRLAEEKGISAICADALQLIIETLGCLDVHRDWVEGWRIEASRRKERTAIYLTGVPWLGDQAITDFLTQPDWRARMRFAAEIMFPASRYMLDRYDAKNRAFVPFLHVRRLLIGAWSLAFRLTRDLVRRSASSRAALARGQRFPSVAASWED